MKMERVGCKHFGGEIDITDPCYDKDVWCRMKAYVKPGNYDCVIWKQKEKGVYHEKEYSYEFVGAIGIYLDGHVPPEKQMREIGSIGVDAGLAGFFMNKPDYTDEQWHDFCEPLKEGNAWINDEGFFSWSGLGDGGYGVYAFKKGDDIVALEIRF